MQANGGGLAFIQRSRSLDDTMDESEGSVLLAYVNGDHEYAVFNPHGVEMQERKVRHTDSVSSLEGTGLPWSTNAMLNVKLVNEIIFNCMIFMIGQSGYASIYGKLPEFKLEAIEARAEAVTPSERSWETIFSGPSHSLPPLTKLCSAFLESFLEKRTGMVN